MRVGVGVAGLVDPAAGGQRGWFGRFAHEAVGAGVVGACEHGGAGGADLGGAAVVDIGGGHQADAAVAVNGVVVGEEPSAERAGVLDRAEPVGGTRGSTRRS